MSEAVTVALITGCLSLTGVWISNFAAARKRDHALQTTQAVMETKLEELTREVRHHNNFAQRMPVVENQIEMINYRLDKVEGGQVHGIPAQSGATD